MQSCNNLNQDLFINSPIKFLMYEKWNFICENLGKVPVDLIVGENVGGSPITEQEISFTISKLKEAGCDV